MGAHFKNEIRPGDRHDRILRLLLGGVNWREKNPAYCPAVLSGRWISAGVLIDELQDGGLLPVGSLSLATDISTCRHHLQRRWPGATIENRLERRNGKTLSFYRITARAAADTRLPRAAGPPEEQETPPAAAAQPWLFEGAAR